MLDIETDKTLFQSTLPLRGTTCPESGREGEEFISIHAPLAGNDANRWIHLLLSIKFQSTLPLRGTTRHGCKPPRPSKFQSTLPLRGTTIPFRRLSRFVVFQSTLPLRGTTTSCRTSARRKGISIHAPLAGNDLRARFAASRYPNFNPRSPCGERLASMPVYLYRVKFQSTLPLRGTTQHVGYRDR